MVLKRIYIFGALLKSYMPNPSPTPQTTGWTRVSRIFPSFKFVYGEGNGELQQVALFYEGTQKLKTNTSTASLSQGLLFRILD